MRLDDAAVAAVDPDTQWYAASLFKLAVLYEIERQIDAGVITRDEHLFLTADDYAEDLGTAGALPVAEDGSLSVAEALDAMVTLSDNTTAVALGHLAGTANIDATLVELGLVATSVNTEELPTTASDMALLMEAIAIGRGLSDDAANEARALLLQQRTRFGIPAGLPDGVTVGNKTGTWPGDTHDVAFVLTPLSMYIVAILTDRDWGWDTISEVSAAIYEAMTYPQ
jgi:beta-lactamase class A